MLAATLRRDLVSTERWMATVGQLAQDPVLLDDLAARITDAVVDAADQGGRLDALLGERDGSLASWTRERAAMLPDQVRELVQPRVRALLDRPELHDAWLGANERGHASVVALLRGETELVRLVGEELRLELGAVVRVLADVLEREGGLVARLVAELLPRELDRHLVLLRSPQLATARVTLERLDLLVGVAPALAAGFALGAVLLAPRRAATAGWAVAGAAAIAGGGWALGRSLTAGLPGTDGLPGDVGVRPFEALTALVTAFEAWVGRGWDLVTWTSGVALVLIAVLIVVPMLTRWERGTPADGR